MSEQAPGGSPADPWRDPARCHFEVSPPRHFVYPAILLLLSEKPRNGYRLIDPILGFGFGGVDRPTVYRALADLERDGLLESWEAEPKAGATRHVYAVTAAGRLALDHWMGVLAAERNGLDRVMQRYAILDHPQMNPAGAAVALRPAAAAQVASRPASRPGARRAAGTAGTAGSPAGPSTSTAGATTATATADPDTPPRFVIVPERSAIMIRARSNVGTIEFGTTGVRGDIRTTVRGGSVDCNAPVAAHLEIDVASLTSGNALYDAELMHRVHARLFPAAAVDLIEARPIGSEDRFAIRGLLTFHGVTAALAGAVSVATLGEHGLVVSGDQVVDIRDFQIAAPTILMLKIYPDVRVFLRLEAELEEPAVQEPR
jgi:PadR family transcriptional regulator